ncbi:MAG: hypothetical protein U5K69_02290 [Balneolaceae bacterium]|nr:hypothetical protein [Balneolaceae bacterium]
MKIIFRQRLGKTLEKFDVLVQQNLLPYQLEDADHLVRWYENGYFNFSKS